MWATNLRTPDPLLIAVDIACYTRLPSTRGMCEEGRLIGYMGEGAEGGTPSQVRGSWRLAQFFERRALPFADDASTFVD